MTSKRILVIGAGTSGLTAIKCILEEGMNVVCFEKTDNFGGRWRYRENRIPGIASIMKSTISIYSKEMLAFSDFPPPAEFPNYFHNRKMIEYLILYAQHFNLLQHIQYNREVVQVIQATDYSITGQWQVTSITNGWKTTECFDGVVVCTGRLSHPYIPESYKIESFKGRVIHSHELKTSRDFENLNVLVIGNGNSAMDAAVEISTLANQVYLSTRNGTWVFPKVGSKGLPFDLELIRRCIQISKSYFKNSVNNYIEKYLETKLLHHTYRLKPNHRALDGNLVMNDMIPDKILTGRVCIKGAVCKFSDNEVLFEGEDEMTGVDVIVFATGYRTKIPFLQDQLYKTEDGKSNLIKNIFPSGLKHSTLALIGFINIQGPLGPVSECQARWAARILGRKQQFRLQDSERIQMNSDLECSKTDYIEYMDELADAFAAKPNISTLLFKDPVLCWACLTGPFLSYQYRLNGPHSWKEARKSIIECYDRVKFPLSTASTYFTKNV